MPPRIATTWPLTENPITLGMGGVVKNGLTDGLDWNDMRSIAGGPGAALGTASSPTDPTDNVMTVQGVFDPAYHFVRAKVVRDLGYAPVASHELEVNSATIVANSIKLYGCSFSHNNPAINYGRWNGPLNNFFLGSMEILSGTDFYGSGGAQDGDDIVMWYDSRSGFPIISLYINDMVTPHLVWRDNDPGKHMTGNPCLGVFARPDATLDLTRYKWGPAEFGDSQTSSRFAGFPRWPSRLGA